MKRVLPILALLIVIAAPLAHAQEPAKAADITVTPAELTLEVGAKITLEAAVTDADGNVIEAPVMFFSRARRSVGVNAATGELEAYRPGTFVVMALVPTPGEGFSRRMLADAVSTQITVIIPQPPLAAISLVDPPAAYFTQTRVRLTTLLTDASGAKRSDPVEFSSSNPAIAEINQLGTLTLKTVGDVEITAGSGDVSVRTPLAVQPNRTAKLELQASAMQARTGDVIHFTALPHAENGDVIDALPVQFAFQSRTINHDIGEPGSGLITEDGRFVADTPGEYTIVATSGNHTATTTVAITPRDIQREIEVLGQGRVSDRATSDLWVWEGPDGRDYAATGTHSADGHAYFWDVTDPSNIQQIDTIKVDARTVNDVKVSADGRIAVISREGASNRRNGLLILDVSDLHNKGAQVLARYDDALTGGVHNVFIYEDHVYALSAGQRYDVINIEDPSNPHKVGSFELDTPGHSIHDVWVTDGIAYSSNWSDGVVAVDIGGGGKGGTPRNPVELGRTPYPNGWNHAAFPFQSPSTDRFYMIGGDEAGLRGGTPGYDGEPPRMQGWVHFFEWDEWNQPHEVARYQVPEAGTHNLWVDEENELLYVAYYQGGLRVVDISGELLGDLYRQGREIAYFLPFDPEGFVPNAPFTWGPQPHKGNIFFADYHSGLWAVRLKPRPDDAPPASEN